MARKKVKLAWIVNASVRRTTFRKRRHGLIKKVTEIATLCDVQACAIVYGPDEPEPEVWPSVPEARRMVQSFLDLPEVEQYKKMTNQESFLQVRARKLNDHYQRSGRNIHDLELCMLLYEYMCSGRDMNELNQHDAESVFYYAEMREKMIYDLLDSAMGREGSSGNASNALIEHPQFQHHNLFPGVAATAQLSYHNVFPNVATTSNFATTSHVANAAVNVFPNVASTSYVATSTQAANASLNEQMMFPQNFGMVNGNQWINPNYFCPFN